MMGGVVAESVCGGGGGGGEKDVRVVSVCGGGERRGERNCCDVKKINRGSGSVDG